MADALIVNLIADDNEFFQVLLSERKNKYSLTHLLNMQCSAPDEKGTNHFLLCWAGHFVKQHILA
jgi:hypothetical protein